MFRAFAAEVDQVEWPSDITCLNGEMELSIQREK